MTLKEFLDSNPDAKALHDQLIVAARAEGQKSAETRAEHVGSILASDAYKSNAIIQSKGVDALAGKLSVEAFDQLVAMADMIAEQTKLAASAPIVETPASSGASSGAVDVVAKLTRDQIDKLTAADFAAMSPEVVKAVEARTAELIQGGN